MILTNDEKLETLNLFLDTAKALHNALDASTLSVDDEIDFFVDVLNRIDVILERDQ